MVHSDNRELNQQAYRRLKSKIAESYPPGRLVAISNGEIVADADTLDSLNAELIAMGKKPTETLVVEAGVDYPDNVTIFL